MMHSPWDRAQPDEWLPRSLRLCWGSDGGGGGFSGDGGGGWGSEGAATTGGGDWGSAGAADFSGSFATGDLGAWAGTAYDASTSGTGAGGGGDWGSFGATDFSGSLSPNAIYTDIAGPNPGVTTGGGDWGSAGTTSFAGTGGGPGGTFSADSGVGTGGGFYGSGGGLFGDYGGGFFGDQGGGNYGGGGGGYTGGGGAFSGTGRSSVTDSTPGYVGTASGGKDVTGSQVSSPYADDTGPEGRGETEGPAALPAATEAAEVAPSEAAEVAPTSSFGAPTTSESEQAAPSQAEASPSLSDAAPAGNIGGHQDAAPAHAGEGSLPSTSAFGPQSLNADYQGSPYASNYDQDAGPSQSPASFDSRFGDWGPSQAYSQGTQALSELTQTALSPDYGYDFSGSPYADMGQPDSFDSRFGFDPSTDTTNWGAVFEGAAPGRGETGLWGDLPGIYSQGISNLFSDLTAAPARDTGRSIFDINTWFAPQNQEAARAAGEFFSSLPSALNPNNWSTPSWLTPSPVSWPSRALTEADLQQPELQDTFDSRFDTTNWGSVFEGAEPPPSEGIDPGSEQYGTEAYAPGGIDPGAEQYGVETGINPGAEQYGIEARTPAVEAFIPAARETDFEYASQPVAGQPTYDTTMESGPLGQPTTTDDASTRGSDPALSGYPADPGAGPLGQPAEGQPGAPGTPGAAPGAAPQAGGQSFVSEAAVSAVANAASNAALNVNAPSEAVDAAGTAAYNAALGLQSPAAQAEAAGAAALAHGATQQQADAISAATLAAANSQPAFTPGQPGQQQQGQPGPAQPGAPVGPQAPTQTTPPPPSLVEQAQTAAPGVPMPTARPVDAPPGLVDMAQPGPPGGIGSDIVASPEDDDDTPEPQDTSQPPQDPNAPRPPENIPGQPIGLRGTYENPHADTPQTSRTYRDSGRSDYPQGRPGITFRSARQAGITPRFNTDDINTEDLDARLIENINRALEAMEQRTGIPAGSLRATSGWRPAHRTEAIEHGMDPRTGQESVYSRSNPIHGRHFAAAPPGRSNHAPGRAIDFSPKGDSGRALGWLRTNAREFDLETLGIKNGKPFDVPHIQLRGSLGANRPSEREQAQQRALDAQSRQIAIDMGLLGGARTQQARPAPPPGSWRGIGGDIGREARLAPPVVPQVEVVQPPEVAQPEVPAARPPPTMPLPPAETPAPVAPVDRPPADIPVQTAPPAIVARTAQAAMQFAKFLADNLAKTGKLPSNREEGQAALNALAQELGKAGYPTSVAQKTILETATQGSIKAGYGPNSAYNTFGNVTRAINEMTGTAMQGYRPSKTPETQGPPSPADLAPGKRSEAPPFGSFVIPVAGGRDVGAPPAIEGEQLPGRAEGEAPLPGGIGKNLDPQDLLAPTDPRSELAFPPTRDRGIFDPDILQWQQQEQQEYQQNLDPRGWQQATLDFLSNFNPISTAEARGRGQSYPVPPGSTRSNPHFTFYGPGAGGKMEGAFETSRPNQAGTNVPITLDMVRSAREQGRDLLVTLASDPSRYGETLPVGTVTYVSPIDGKQYTLDNVRGFVHDTGSAFKGRPEKVDIATSDYTGWSGRAAGDHTALAHIGASPNAIAVRGPGEIGTPDMPAIAISPAPTMPMRGLAKGGRVDKDEPVVVGEEGPEFFIPDQPGTVFPHMPQPGKGKNVDRWPKVPAPEYPGRYGGLEREYERQTREAQVAVPSLVDLIDSERLRLNAANWYAMLNDPSLVALGRSRMDDRREGIDPGAEQYGAFIPAPVPAADPPDPTNPMAQALGYGSIRRPLRVGRQVY